MPRCSRTIVESPTSPTPTLRAARGVRELPGRRRKRVSALDYRCWLGSAGDWPLASCFVLSNRRKPHAVDARMAEAAWDSALLQGALGHTGAVISAAVRPKGALGNKRGVKQSAVGDALGPWPLGAAGGASQ